jgi:hypothetical protein
MLILLIGIGHFRLIAIRSKVQDSELTLVRDLFDRRLLDEIGPEGFSALPSYPQIFPIFWGLG